MRFRIRVIFLFLFTGHGAPCPVGHLLLVLDCDVLRPAGAVASCACLDFAWRGYVVSPRTGGGSAQRRITALDLDHAALGGHVAPRPDLINAGGPGPRRRGG